MQPGAPDTFTLWLVRHAEVRLPDALQGQSCCYGASDLPAHYEATEAAAQALAPQLQALWRNGTPRWVSGLQRARQMAEALDRALGALQPDWRTDERLNEFDFGHWELTPWAAIPRPAFDAWTADFAHHAFGGAESVQQMVHRVRAALCHTARPALQDGQAHAIWVAHAGVARALQVFQAHGAGRVGSAADWPQQAPALGGLCPYVFAAHTLIH